MFQLNAAALVAHMALRMTVVSPESSPLTSGVCGFLVTTLAVALLTWTQTREAADSHPFPPAPLWLPPGSPPPAGVSHLDLPAFHDGSVQLFSGPVGLSRVLKGHEPKSLQGREVVRFFKKSHCSSSKNPFQAALLTFEPLSLKIISTSRIFPNC